MELIPVRMLEVVEEPSRNPCLLVGHQPPPLLYIA